MKKKSLIKWVAGFAAVAVVLTGVAGLNQSTAMAKEGNNVTGKIQVETAKTYKVNKKNMEANVKVPQIITEKKATSGVTKLNKDIRTYTNGLIKEFKKNLKEDGYRSLTVSYKIMTDNDKMFTLRLTTTDALGSSNTTYKFYHLDKQSGKTMQLKDLFKKNANYVTVLSNEIKKQMREQMKDEKSNKTYFLDSKDKDLKGLDFKAIKKNQNFYINKKGNLVISFDKYEVAPGYMGTPQFTISQKTLADILI